MPTGYPDFSWFVRAVKTLPIVAVAALAGGVIGGFSVLTIDSVLTASPRQAASLSPSPVPAKPVRAIDGAPPAPDPTVGVTAAPPPPPQAAAPPSQVQAAAPSTQATPAPAAPVTPPVAQTQTPWPDAMSRSHAPPAVVSTTTPPQPVPANLTPAAPLASPAPATAQASDGDTHGDAVNQAPQPQTSAPPLKTANGPVARPEAAKRRDVTSSRMSADSSARGPNGRRVYDYYGNTRYVGHAKNRDYGDTRTQDADTRDRDDNDADNAPAQSSGAPQVQVHQSSTRDDQGVITTRTRVVSRRRQLPDPDAQLSDAPQEAAPRPEPFWGFGFRDHDRYDDDQ